MTATLLDGNVLVALTVIDHVHHQATESWFETLDSSFATCPTTQGTLIRLLIREGQTGAAAKAVVSALTDDARHEFWSDELSYSNVPFAGIVGHRQVTDAYLAATARARGGRLATFDQGMAQLHPDVTHLVPTTGSGEGP